MSEVATHIVRCTTNSDPYVTEGKEYKAFFDPMFPEDAEIIEDDDGDRYFMFPTEYEIVREINDGE